MTIRAVCSIKQPTRCTINLKFIVLSHIHRSTCFGHCCAHHQEPPPTAFAATCYHMIAGLDVLQAVARLLVKHYSTCFGHCCAHHQEPPPTAFAATCYRMIAGLDVPQAVVGLLVNRPQLEARQSYDNQRLQRQLEGAPDDGHNSARNMLSGVYATKQ
jgi:hypothetical protein